MNIQIFGTTKCFDTKKAQRYFKERNIKVQFINLKEKSMSKSELTAVMQAVGGVDELINPKAKDKDTLVLITYIADEDKFEKLLENQQILLTPIVRNGKQATAGTHDIPGRIGSDKLKIFVDADVCSVVKIVEQVVKKYGIPCTLFCP